MRHVIDKTRLADSAFKTCITLIFFEISVWLDPIIKMHNGERLYRYIQQGTYVIAVILTFFAVISYRKLMPRTMRRAVLDKFLYVMRKMASGVAGISKKMLSLLGIKLERFKRGKDERSFIFGDEEEAQRKRKRHQIKSNSKWRDMNENAEKIRFLYIKYIVKKIKDGYKFRTALTPCEVREELGFDEEAIDPQLFDMYNGARYSGGSVFITDEQVEIAQDIVSGKKK